MTRRQVLTILLTTPLAALLPRPRPRRPVYNIIQKKMMGRLVITEEYYKHWLLDKQYLEGKRWPPY